MVFDFSEHPTSTETDMSAWRESDSDVRASRPRRSTMRTGSHAVSEFAHEFRPWDPNSVPAVSSRPTADEIDARFRASMPMHQVRDRPARRPWRL